MKSLAAAPRCDVWSSSSFIPRNRQTSFKCIAWLILSCKMENKTWEVNLIHIFVWNQICSCYLTLVHWFCLSDSPIGGKLDVFHWLSSCKKKSISEHPAAAGPFIDISDGTLEEKLASFVSHVTLMADLFQGAKNWQAPGLSEQTAKPSLLVSSCKHSA